MKSQHYKIMKMWDLQAKSMEHSVNVRKVIIKTLSSRVRTIRRMVSEGVDSPALQSERAELRNVLRENHRAYAYNLSVIKNFRRNFFEAKRLWLAEEETKVNG